MDYPKTRKEAKTIGATHYFTGEPCVRGHIALRKTKGSCVECMKEDWQRDAEKRADYFRRYSQSEAGKEAKRRYYEANREAVIARAAARPPEEKQRYRRAWKAANPLQVRASTKNRRRKHRQASPPWLTRAQRGAMRSLYEMAITMTRITGVQHVVDHIVPLRGTDVCGLHVPWNLQVITQEENLRKSNRLLEEESANAFQGAEQTDACGSSGENQ